MRTSLAISFKLDVLGPRDQEIITMQTLLPVCDKLPVHLYAVSGTITNNHSLYIGECLSFFTVWTEDVNVIIILIK